MGTKDLFKETWRGETRLKGGAASYKAQEDLKSLNKLPNELRSSIDEFYSNSTYYDDSYCGLYANEK